MKLEPLFDRVILKALPKKTKTQSGLMLPDSNGERPMLAKVVCAGDGGETDGKQNKMYVKKGDTVLYSRFGGIEFKADEEELIIIRQSDILAIVKEEN